MPIAPGSNLNDVIFAAYRLHADIVAAGDAVARPFGLSAARWQLLGIVTSNGDVTASDLARRIGTARQSVQRIVSEMVSEGLVTLADNPRHRRAKLIRLTACGHEAYKAVMAVWTPYSIQLERQVGPDAARDLALDMADLAGAFRTIAQHRGPTAASTPAIQEERQP